MRAPKTPSYLFIATLGLVVAGASGNACADPGSTEARVPVAEEAVPVVEAVPSPTNPSAADPSPVAEPTSELERIDFEGKIFAEELFELDHGCDEPAMEWVVGRGETLDHYARWAGTPVEEIALENGREVTDGLLPGETLYLLIDEETAGSFLKRQQAFQDRRRKRYLRKHPVTATTTHTVRSGEIAWTLARKKLGIPLWLLEDHNPGKDLRKLRAGQVLTVPVLGEVEVEKMAEGPADGEKG